MNFMQFEYFEPKMCHLSVFNEFFLITFHLHLLKFGQIVTAIRNYKPKCSFKKDTKRIKYLKKYFGFVLIKQ